MKILDENFNSFINNRIDETISFLRKNNKNYQLKQEQYNKLYHELYHELSSTQLQKFDKILELLNSMSGDELISIYKTATHDFFQLKK